MAGNKTNLKVLVADDEKNIAESLATILTLNGHDAQAVFSGEQAVSAAADLKPDVLISDVLMPGMNGIDAAVSIRQSLPACHVILISAATPELLGPARPQAQRFELLQKPLHPRILLERIGALAELLAS